MSSIVIADSSCLIGLAKIGKLDVLYQLFGSVIIPPAVYHEVVVRGVGRLGAEEVKNANWIETRAVKNNLAVTTLKMLMLGAGEAEAITLAAENDIDFLILDDGKARQIALEMSLPVVGTVAVLARAAKKGLIDELDPILIKLRQAGFRFPITYE